MEKLLRKFIFFFDIYKKTINQKNIQIIFLYDNVEAIKVLSFDKIKEDTEKILKTLAGKFQNFNKIIFQLIYFNYSDYTVKEMLESKQKDKTIEEKNETIKNQENEIKTKDQTIIQQGNELNNKDQIIQEKDQLISGFNEFKNQITEIIKFQR